jgi:hypothetical protein
MIVFEIDDVEAGQALRIEQTGIRQLRLVITKAEATLSIDLTSEAADLLGAWLTGRPHLNENSSQL